jgi:putative protease
LINHLKEIGDAGVVSLKIEGRMKRPEYVAAAVTACKKAINGDFSDDNERVLRSVFSRSGFTDGYFTGKRINMFGTRQKDDVVAANDVLKDLSHLYDNENPLIAVDLKFVCKQNEPITLTATTEKKVVTATTVAPERAINKPMTVESVTQRLSKFGGTQYYLNKIDVQLDDGLIAPASVINALRREIVDKLNDLEEIEFEQHPLDVVAPNEKCSTPYYTARFLDASSIPNNHPFKRIFIPIWSTNEDFVDNRAGVEIPRGLFGKEHELKKRLAQLKKIGVKNALCSNLGAYKTAKEMGFNVYGDFGLNVFNSETAKLFNSPILSFELTMQQANSINHPDTGIIAYGKLPLMITRNCPVKNNIGCENCRKNGSLTDRKGYKFDVKCSPYPCVEIFNPLPIYLGDRIKEIKTDFIHFYFTDESAQQVSVIIDSFKNQLPPPIKHTRGLYYRGVL